MSVSSDSSSRQPHHSTRLLSTLGLIFAAVLLVVLGLAAWTGYQAGLTTREDQLRATQTVDLQAQFDLGVADLAAQRYRMAAARFEYVLSQAPDYPDARAKLAAAQAGLNVTPTPPPPTPLPVTGEDPADLLALAQAYVEAGNWDMALSQLTRLHALDAEYERLTVEGLLFQALRGRGVTRIQEDEMEAGIFDLDQAAAFQPLDADARSFRAWARLYLAAKSYWGLDWPKTVAILGELYVLAPNFKDTTRLYYQASRNYADLLYAAGDPCSAAQNYATARLLFDDAQLAERQAAAQAECVPTPIPSGTEATATPSP